MTTAFRDEDGRWRAVLERDASADGRFVYAVRTTGVFCRPSCASRRPRRDNVSFFADAAAAERAGFRACLRCKPEGPSAEERNAALVADLCRFIEEAESTPSLAILAERAGASPHHTHRLFKRVTGLTPRAYAAARRRQRLRDGLPEAESVTAAIYEAGFGSSGRMYEQSNAMLGMTPSQFRQAGSETTIHFAVGECSLGAILVAATERGICAVSLGDDPEALVHELEDRFDQADLVGGDASFEHVVASVIGSIDEPSAAVALPLDVRGTAFQQRVWRALTEIPPGQTATYAGIAERIGQPSATRAVAQACAANPIAVAIPCHRVIRSDGSLSGYRWGIDRKRRLLDRERATATATESARVDRGAHGRARR